jgi:NADPH:quinone reductase-like Zn-dependent oxidoreductase
MKAIVYDQYGTPDVLQLRDVDKPVPGDHDVLIKVYASSVNSWDWDLLTGRPRIYRLMFGIVRPKLKILGADVAGKVEAVGKNVTKFRAGDDVFGDLCEGKWGGFAEYVCASENVLTLKPSWMTFDQAASLPQAGLLALQGLRNKGRQIQPGQKVLINGGGGGVGTFAIQIAKSSGAEVTGVDSAIKLDTMKRAGADHVIDYKKEDFINNGHRYDYILDVVATRSILKYKRSLAPKGTFAMVGGKVGSILQAGFIGPVLSKKEGKQLGLVFHKPNKGIDELTELVQQGKVTPVIGRCFALYEVPEALRLLGDGRSEGKVVISIATLP